MGWWSLKPEEKLSAYECLTISEDEVLDFVDITSLKKGYKLSELDREHIYNQIKEGYLSGEINDWDND